MAKFDIRTGATTTVAPTWQTNTYYVQTFGDTYDLLTSIPHDGSTNYTSYYIGGLGGRYFPVTGVSKIVDSKFKQLNYKEIASGHTDTGEVAMTVDQDPTTYFKVRGPDGGDLIDVDIRDIWTDGEDGYYCTSDDGYHTGIPIQYSFKLDISTLIFERCNNIYFEYDNSGVIELLDGYVVGADCYQYVGNYNNIFYYNISSKSYYDFATQTYIFKNQPLSLYGDKDNLTGKIKTGNITISDGRDIGQDKLNNYYYSVGDDTNNYILNSSTLNGDNITGNNGQVASGRHMVVINDGTPEGLGVVFNGQTTAKFYNRNATPRIRGANLTIPTPPNNIAATKIQGYDMGTDGNNIYGYYRITANNPPEYILNTDLSLTPIAGEYSPQGSETQGPNGGDICGDAVLPRLIGDTYYRGGVDGQWQGKGENIYTKKISYFNIHQDTVNS